MAPPLLVHLWTWRSRKHRRYYIPKVGLGSVRAMSFVTDSTDTSNNASSVLIVEVSQRSKMVDSATTVPFETDHPDPMYVLANDVFHYNTKDMIRTIEGGNYLLKETLWGKGPSTGFGHAKYSQGVLVYERAKRKHN